ncbi:MAG: hypothetical protein VYB04_01365 [Pseudomonadota bacterium]|nr:hypothetical protein [Pseudomonadota bacterium]
MPHFIFAYHGGKTPETPEETETEIERWRRWFDHLGAAVVDPGNPVGMSKTVSAVGVSVDGGANPLSGYTIINTETIDEAIELAKTCPIIGDGSIEVAEIHEVPA